MAKLNTAYAREIAALNASAEAVSPGSTPHRTQCRFALRSDRVILRRFRGDLATGYSKFGKVKPNVELNHATLKRIVTSLGYTVE